MSSFSKKTKKQQLFVEDSTGKWNRNKEREREIIRLVTFEAFDSDQHQQIWTCNTTMFNPSQGTSRNLNFFWNQQLPRREMLHSNMKLIELRIISLEIQPIISYNHILWHANLPEPAAHQLPQDAPLEPRFPGRIWAYSWGVRKSSAHLAPSDG